MTRQRLLFFGVAVTCLVVSGHALAWFEGAPMGVAGILALMTLGCWAYGVAGAPPRAGLWAAVVVVLAAAKVMVWALGPSHGLDAEYRAGSVVIDRVDRSLELRGDAMPLHFFNDIRRFNFFAATEPKRDQLPFEARWSGLMRVDEQGGHRLSLTANGSATLAVGPHRAELAPPLHSATIEVNLPLGFVPIEVTYSRAPEGMPWLVVELDGRPIPPARLVRSPSVGVLDPFAAWMANAISALIVLCLLAAFAAHWRSRRSSAGDRGYLALLSLAALIHAVVLHAHLEGRSQLLSGGNDWLAYESYAREVLGGDPLVREGKPFGAGSAYYYQPLYIYWLGLTHLVAGEGLFGPLLGNWVLGVVANVLVYHAAREFGGRLAGWVAAGVFAACRLTFFAPTAGLLLSENLLIALVPLFLWQLGRAIRTLELRPLIVGGIALGLAGLARSTPLAVAPFAALLVIAGARRLGSGWREAILRAALLTLVCTATVAPATVRNLIVSGRPTLITSSAGANLWEMHRPGPNVELRSIERGSCMARLNFDRQTCEVWEFARQDPVGYAATLAPMFLHAVGVVGAIQGTWDVHPGLIGMWAAYLLSILVAPAARSLPALLLHAFVATHLAFMTFIFSHQYGFRLILPMYVAMAPIIGLGVAAIPRPTLRRVDKRAPGFATAVGLAAMIVVILRVPSQEELREAFYTLEGDVADVARTLSTSPTPIFDAYFAGDDRRSPSIAYLRGVAYPNMRWVDAARGVVLPPTDDVAWVLPPHVPAELATQCLGTSGLVLPPLASRPCRVPTTVVDAPFGYARVVGYDAPGSIEPGRPADVTVHWLVLDRAPNRARPVFRLVDAKGRRWAQGEVTVYPSGSWRPGELVIGTGRLETEPTMPPGAYRFEFGFVAASGPARLAEDGAAGQRGALFTKGAETRVVSRSTPVDPAELNVSARPNVDLGGLRLIGAAVDRESPRPGERVRLDLYWQQAGRTAPADIVVALLDEQGQPLRETRGGPVDSAYPTTDWKPREIVRDVREIVMPPTLPSGGMSLGVAVVDPGEAVDRYRPILDLRGQPITRRTSEPEMRVRQSVQLGTAMRLVGFDIRSRRVSAAEPIELKLVWQSLAPIDTNLMFSLRLVDGDGDVVVQQDLEPAAGRRPTASWLPPEFVEDQRRLRIPRDVPRGRYQLVVVVTSPEDDRRLTTASGEDRVVLDTEVTVQ
jgi:hypothetical protein